MKNSTLPQTGYRLAARLRGGRLSLTPEMRDAASRGYLLRIASIERRCWRERCDRDAFAQSVEWERLGDFLAATGSVPRAVKAFGEAMECCLDGVPYAYDPGGGWGPCRVLRQRFFSLLDKALALCRADRRLAERLLSDPLIAEAVQRLGPHR